ncbi:MAG: serine protease [Planctomycetes bacterium]|nr:serine protease [Planctomycetota bacterium]
MRTLMLGLAWLYLSSAAVFAQVSGPAAERVRKCTLSLSARGEVLECQGAAFVVGSTPDLSNKKGETLTLLVAAAHIVDLEEDPVITVILNAGSKDEKAVKAGKVAVDWTNDLAILSVQGTGYPEPLPFADGDGPAEGASLSIFGFPDNPGPDRHHEIRCYEALVQARQKDAFGRLAAYQLSADILAGGGGGPLCNAAGKVVAIGLMTLKKRGLSLAIPVRELRDVLDGKGSGLLVEQKDLWQGALRLQATTVVVDPRRTVRKVSVLALPRSSLKTELAPAADGSWKPLPGVPQEVELKRTGSTASAEIVLKDASATDADAPWLFQVKVVREDNTVWCAEPLAGTVNFAKGLTDSAKSTGKDAWSDEAPAAAAPAAEWKPKPLAGKTEDREGCKLTPIAMPGAEAHIPCLCWNADQTAFYAAEKAGTVRLISWPDLVEKAEVNLGHPVSQFAMSHEGLVIVLPDLEDAWLLDSITLQVKNKFHAKKAGWVAASPASSVAFVACAPVSGPISPDNDILTAFDLKSGKKAGEYSGDKVGKEEIPHARRPSNMKAGQPMIWNAPALTPDGKFLFVHSYFSIYRFKVSGPKIALEEVSPPCGGDAARFVFSPDSALVSMHGGMETPIRGAEELGKWGAYIFKVKDLQVPLARSSFHTPWFVKEGGQIMTAEGDGILIFNWKRERVREIPMGTAPGSFGGAGGYFLLHPTGTGAIILRKGVSARIDFEK